MCSGEVVRIRDSDGLFTARAAEAGYVAATLAARGFTGAEHILEGEQGFFRAFCPDPDTSAVLANSEAPWQLTRTSLKPWPCCRHTHPAIDAALALHPDIGDQRLSRVEIRTFQAALDVCDRPAPQTSYAAKFSLQHCVNVALSDGEVGFESFDDAYRARLAESSSNTNVNATPEFDDAYPGRWGAAVSATLPSGEVITAVRKDCKGDPDSPLSAQEIVEKAHRVARNGDQESNPSSLIEQILSMPQASRIPPFPLPARRTAP